MRLLRLNSVFSVATLVLIVVYLYYASYYQASARELKRLDSRLRSDLYSRFTESLSGTATINAFKESERFIKQIQYLIDLENRALILTIANQVGQFHCILIPSSLS
jgi:ABC-type multidrug transport system fused ATPase/permease subunit